METEEVRLETRKPAETRAVERTAAALDAYCAQLEEERTRLQERIEWLNDKLALQQAVRKNAETDADNAKLRAYILDQNRLKIGTVLGKLRSLLVELEQLSRSAVVSP